MGPVLLVLGAAALCLELGVLRPAIVEAQGLQQSRKLIDCPEKCVCGTWLKLPRASCTGQNFYSIHTGISSVVQALDLSNNSISKLEDRQLSRAGLTRLRYLNLSRNGINEIGMDAFQDLKNLTVLDLSYNHIDYISRDTFFYNQNLKILFLAGNKFDSRVPDLQSNSLQELDLSSCKIRHLVKETFMGLKQLRKLDLSKNMLFELKQEVLRAMPFLKNLVITGNYWSCDGAMLNLKLYMRSKNIHSDTVCPTSPVTTKFENMIALQTVSAESDLRKMAESRSNKDPWDMESWRELEEAVQEQEQNADNASSGIFASALSNVSPFWFLLIGFLLGSGATMVVTYLWLSTTISCLIPRIRRAEAADSVDASSQRVSLLRHLWQQENMGNSEDGGTGVVGSPPAPTTILPTTIPCPGTPPPPYREVMQHRNLYPRAAMAAAAQQSSGRTLLTLDDTSAPTVTAYNI